MTDIKPGDRVHVEYDGTVEEIVGTVEEIVGYSGGFQLVLRQSNGLTVRVPTDWCTLIASPLRVGDILDADAAEPPVGTVVIDSEGDPWKRNRGYGWDLAAGGVAHWATVRDNGPLRVAYLPGGES